VFVDIWFVCDNIFLCVLTVDYDIGFCCVQINFFDAGTAGYCAAERDATAESYYIVSAV